VTALVKIVQRDRFRAAFNEYDKECVSHSHKFSQS